jgi:hypothetical protein
MTALNGRAGTSFVRAVVTLIAVILSFLTVYAISAHFGAGVQPAIVAAIMAMTLGRRPRSAERARTLLAPLTIACVAPVAGAVGWLLHALPVVGAIVFTGGMSLSVWLRNFGALGKGAGGLIALPLLAILIVPGRPTPAPGGRIVDLAVLASAGLIAFAYASAVTWLAAKAGVHFAAGEVSEPPRRRDARVPADPKRAAPSASTRMAAQMAVALACAFVSGWIIFPGHFSWTVLTAFIVCSGARGRGDAAYKGVLRLLGAVSGTLAAVAVTHLWAPTGVTEAAAIFGILFLALWLRDFNYAYWAGCITLILALLGSGTGLTIGLLGVRLEAILLGAICAVAAAWFVFPIRTEAVIRRRLADALLAFDELVAHAHLPDADPAAKLARFEHRMTELDGVAPPVRWHRRVFASRDAAEHPARWIDLAGDLRHHARTIESSGGTTESRRAAIRRAIGQSRRAIANHGNAEKAAEGPTIGAALDRLHQTIATTADPQT